MIPDRRISQDPVHSLSSCHAEDRVFRQLDATAPSLSWRRSSISGATILLSAAAEGREFIEGGLEEVSDGVGHAQVDLDGIHLGSAWPRFGGELRTE